MPSKRTTDSQLRQLNLRLVRFFGPDAARKAELAEKVRLHNHCRVGGF